MRRKSRRGGERGQIDPFQPPQGEDQALAGGILGAKLLGFGDRRAASEHALDIGRRAAVVRFAASADMACRSWAGGEVFPAGPVGFIVAAAVARPREIRNFVVLVTRGSQ